MPAPLGLHSDRLAAVRALRTAKGRRDQSLFAFEGPTLLAEAHASSVPIEALYATQSAYDATPLVRELDAQGTPVFLVPERAGARLSDVETPTGLVAVARLALQPVEELFADAAPCILVLGDLADPGNAGTLLRSAAAFGAGGVVFGSLGIDPYHPKVVRGAMGALFRLAIARCEPSDLALAAAGTGRETIGLRAGGSDVSRFPWPPKAAIVVGHERHGLGRWEALCARFAGIAIEPAADSLNAAVAGSIALFSAANERRKSGCQ